MKISFFLAKRFFSQRSTESEEGRKASGPAIRIATAGIAVGLAVMIVSVCVVRGFQREVSEKLIGFAAHIEIIDIHTFASPEAYPLVTDSSVIAAVKQVPGVEHVQRFSRKMGIFKTEDNFAGISLKGVSSNDYDMSFMQSQLVEGEIPEFRDDSASNAIVISRSLAEDLGLKVGDRVYSYFFEHTVKQRRFRVAGIYDTHMRQFDKTYVLTDLYTVNRLNSWLPDQSSGLEVRLSSMDDLTFSQACLQSLFADKLDRNHRVYTPLSIRENPNTAQVLSWLDLLDFNVMVILVIMICVAGFTMISGLLILILERTTTIGLLKALGAGNTRIRHTFLWFAAFIVGRGLLIGNVLGLGIVALQGCFKLVHLNPETYYVDTVPVEVNAWWIVGINLASLVFTMAALILPSHLVSRIEPAKAIRFD